MELNMDRSSISVDFSMSDNEISKCEKYIGGVDKMLEWGAGGSTLYFSSMVGKFVSIENDRGWYDKLLSDINDNVELHYVHQHEYKYDEELDENAFDILEGDGANVSEFTYNGKIINWVTRGRIDWHCYMDYIRHPINLSDRDYDVILVDGRARAMCAYVAKDLLKDNGHLLFHDFNNRPYYHGILKWYEVIDTQDSLAVLTKKIRGNS